MTSSVINSVRRVFAVLECFEDGAAPLGNKAIAERLGAPASSTLALLKSMVAVGYLIQDPTTRAYLPSLRVALLGERISLSLTGGALLDLARDIHGAVGETVSLSEPNGLDMQVVHVLPGLHPLTVNVRAGTVMPMFGSGIGFAALSARPQDEVERLAARAYAGTGREGLPPKAATLERVRAARLAGHVVAYDAWAEGSSAVAWPILMPMSALVVLAVVAPSERMARIEAEVAAKVEAAMARVFPHRLHDILHDH